MSIYYVSKDINTYPNTDFTSLASAISGINSGDIIEILDSEIYSENFPKNINIHSFTIRSAFSDPTKFPTLTFLNDTSTYQTWWINLNNLVTFEQIHLHNFQIAYLSNNNKQLILNKCYITLDTENKSLIIVKNFSTSDVITITNCVFNLGKNGSNYFIYLDNNQNLNNTLGTLINNSFYGNNQSNLIGLNGTNNSNLLIFSNNIFYAIKGDYVISNNLNIFDIANSTNNYFDADLYNSCGNTTTNPQQYGTDSPYLSNSLTKCEDFTLQTNMNITDKDKAPEDDIASIDRNINTPTVGAWEFIINNIINSFRIHIT